MSPAISNNIFLWWLLLRARKTYRATWVLGTWPMGPLNHRPGLVPWVIRSGPGCFVLSRVFIMTQGYVWREPWVIPRLLYESCPIRMCYTSFWPEFQGDSESAAINIKFCLWHPLWLVFVFQPYYKTKLDEYKKDVWCDLCHETIVITHIYDQDHYNQSIILRNTINHIRHPFCPKVTYSISHIWSFEMERLFVTRYCVW